MCNTLRPKFPLVENPPFQLLQSLFYDVTDGRVRLCSDISEFPQQLPFGSDPKLVCKENLVWLRRTVIRIAQSLGFPRDRIERLALAVGEGAGNALRHGGGGYMEVRWDSTSQMTVLIRDVGSGIPVRDLPMVMFCRGYSTTGDLGQGMTLMRTAVDRLWVHTGKDGTTLLLEMYHDAEHDFGWTESLIGELAASGGLGSLDIAETSRS